MELLFISSGVSVIGAILALLTGKNETTSKVIACLCGIAASALAIVVGGYGVFAQRTIMSFATPFAFANFSILLNPLSGLLLIVINVLALLAWIYGASYLDEYKGK